MKVFFKIAALSGLLALAACGGGGGDDSKDLFSLWKREGDNTPVDLSTAKFGTDNLINFYTADGTRCICDLAIIGDQGSGSIAITGCISIPYDTQRNPQCKAIDGAGSYSKTSDVLTITRNGVTANFR